MKSVYHANFRWSQECDKSNHKEVFGAAHYLWPTSSNQRPISREINFFFHDQKLPWSLRPVSRSAWSSDYRWGCANIVIYRKNFCFVIAKTTFVFPQNILNMLKIDQSYSQIVSWCTSGPLSTLFSHFKGFIQDYSDQHSLLWQQNRCSVAHSWGSNYHTGRGRIAT